MKYTWLIDAGHGGLDAAGKYTTDPKIGKLYHHPGFTIYEGVVNRRLAEIVWKKLEQLEISFRLVYHETEDWALGKRVSMANSIQAKIKNCVFLSLHSNAGGGKGLEIFTYKALGTSLNLAKVFEKAYKSELSHYEFRGLKTANFYVLKKTNCPALLVENLFFDNLEEARDLMQDSVLEQIANAIVEAIKQIEKCENYY